MNAMSDQNQTPMRKLILTGTYAQYRDWLALHNANQRAAVYIHEADQFRHFDPVEDEVVLGDCHCDNPAYLTTEYLWFVGGQNVRLAS